MIRTRSTITLVGATLLFAASASAQASQFDIPGPAGSVHFGTKVATLPNGNIVVTDPDASVGGKSNVGAVYLYGPKGGAPISTLSGDQDNDHVGNGGIVLVGNGNFLVFSPDWHGAGTQFASPGAVTWGSGTAGVSGVVSAGNSLVGDTAYDQVGAPSLGNIGITILTNGNYVVQSPQWHNVLGAATWGNGNAGVSGTVSQANSLVGTVSNASVASGGVTALTNGNYVVASAWNDFSNIGVGAATWGSGVTGIKGTISESNSLVGVASGDNIGSHGVIALSNGNYVVASPQWHYAGQIDAGAATWGNGTGGTVGRVLPGNSLVGDSQGDRVGDRVLALSNGNYVVLSYSWNNTALPYTPAVGAATWCSGTAATSAVVGPDNSLIGSTTSDQVGTNAAALSNGNFVVVSVHWHNAGSADAGAATWRSGSGSSSGVVSTVNSLVGSSANDQVGWSITALKNGNYVVSSPYWNAFAGAATWGNGSSGVTGPVSQVNSLVGTAGAYVAQSELTALSNGNYVVASPLWQVNAATPQLGAVTWGNGSSGTSGIVSAANSLVGTTTNDGVGSNGVAALTNGNYVVASNNWDFIGTASDTGAVTWGGGSAGIAGPVSYDNSLVGAYVSDHVGRNSVEAVANGNYVVRSSYFDNMTFAYAGAVALVRGFGPTKKAVIEGIENVHGLNADFVSYAYDPSHDQLAVGRPLYNVVTILKLDLLFRDPFE